MKGDSGFETPLLIMLGEQWQHTIVTIYLLDTRLEMKVQTKNDNMCEETKYFILQAIEMIRRSFQTNSKGVVKYPKKE